MTPKQNVLRFVATLPDDVTYARIKYHVDVMQAIEEGIAQLERGEFIDHDKLFDELLAEDAENQTHLVSRSKTRSAKDSKVHRKRRSAQSNGIHKKAAKNSRTIKKIP